MKKKLSGLLSLWLAAIMVFGLLPVGVLAANETIDLYLYKGTESLTATDDYIQFDEIGFNSIETKKLSLVTDKPLSEQNELEDELAEGYVITGWRLWKRAYSGGVCLIAHVDLPNNTITSQTYAEYCYTDGAAIYEPVLEPIYVPAYTVTFDANGHGEAPDAIENITSGSTISESDSAMSDVEGWEFGGWYKESNCTDAWNFDSDTVTGSITLYAKWTPTEYDITYILNGGALGDDVSNPATYTIETEDFTLNNPTKDGHEFTGWTGTGLSGAATSVTIEKGSTGDRFYIAGWAEEPVASYTVTFDMNGHGSAIVDATVNNGGTVAKPNDPTEEGWTFEGWYTDDTLTTEYDFETPVTADITLYAKWTANPYTVTFNMNGHGSEIADVTVNNGGTVAKPDDPTEEGWTFEGWYTDDTLTTEYDFETPVTADITLHAKWTEEIPEPEPEQNSFMFPNLRTLFFNVNGGTKMKSLPRALGSTVSLKSYVPEREGYTFTGWYADKALTKKITKIVMKDNMTVYAGWEEN